MALAGRNADALAMVDASLARRPDDPHWTFARGWILFEWARLHEARTWLTRAAQLGVDDPQLFLRMGWTCMWTTGPQSAEEWMSRHVASAPDDWMAHFGLGSSLSQQGKIDEAIEAFHRALGLSHDNVTCLIHLFDCKSSQRRWSEAEALARRIIEVEPNNARAWTKLGAALVAQDRHREASDAFERGEMFGKDTGDVDQHLNFAICLRETGRLREALELYERELPLRPSIGANVHYGHALLDAGQLREGWLHYEFRWMQDPLLSLRPPFRKPVWNGQDLRGKTILLRPEQGVGDVIQFIRYAPYVKALGATVLLLLWKNIGELARGFAGVDRVIGPGEPSPEFDYYIPLMSLPRVFGTDLESIPADIPYLRAESDRMGRWKERLDGDSLKVGIVWAGDPAHLRDRYRSVPLQTLAPLFEVQGVQFFSLQKGPQAVQVEAGNFPLVHLGPDLHDFADTASVIAQLDLVVCADTSVAHLAGALGKPVWVLIPTPCDWRWLEHREDSPWYPTMRLFRQARQGDWEEVISRVRIALSDFVANPRLLADLPTATSQRPAPEITPAGTSIVGLKKGLTAVAETRAGIVQYWPDEYPIGLSVERYGEYLQEQLDALSRWIVPGSWVVEIGAGIGLHTLHLSSVIGPRGHLLLYEDKVLHRQVLQQNVQTNRLANVTLMKHRLAQGRRQQGGPPDGSSETIDDLRLEALQWIKISDDTVGLAVLQGAAATLWRHRPSVWAAARDESVLGALAAGARDLGYRCFRIETPLFNPNNFAARSIDVFDGKTSLAVLALPEEIEFDVTLDHCTELPAT